MESQMSHIAGGPNRDSSPNSQEPASNNLARKNFDDLTVIDQGKVDPESRAAEVPFACRIDSVEKALVLWLISNKFSRSQKFEASESTSELMDFSKEWVVDDELLFSSSSSKSSDIKYLSGK